jgi:Leucine-rich repeat (LRR) protein
VCVREYIMGSGASTSAKPATDATTTQIVVQSKSKQDEEAVEVQEEEAGIESEVEASEQLDQIVSIDVEKDDDVEEVDLSPTDQVVNHEPADEDKPEYLQLRQQPKQKSIALQFVGTLVSHKPAAPPPAFNLPVAGWSKDPTLIEQALENRRKHLKVVKIKKKVEKASHKVSNNGPLLDWACLSIRDIPNTDIQFFKSKTSVDLSHNPLNQLPVGIGTQNQLQHLNLHDCDFTLEGLPQSLFSGLTRLTVLDMSCNILDEITEEFGSLCCLKRLILHSNRIERIDDAIAKCPLEHLEVQNNLVKYNK